MNAELELTKTTGGTAEYSWSITSDKPRTIYAANDLALYYKATDGQWFRLLHLHDIGYIAEVIRTVPADLQGYYALASGLVDACNRLEATVQKPIKENGARPKPAEEK